MKASRVLFLLLVTGALASFPARSSSQDLPDSPGSSRMDASTTPVKLDLAYVPPTEKTKVNNYLLDVFGPYPLVSAAFTAGVQQASNAPPEWHQGATGYTMRFGSDFGIAAVSTTTRYGLAGVFKQDTLYYGCECTGFLPRLSHAAISTLTSRREQDGQRVFSIPALVAPYAGSMTATYGWYPSRYGAKDAFRSGNYSLLASVGGNIAMEFLYKGPRLLFRRRHLNNAHISPNEDPSR